MTSPVAAHFEAQAQACDDLGSPFTATLCRLLGERLDATTGFGRRIVEWPGDRRADALSLRACGALHALARSGRDPGLTGVYPPSGADPDTIWSAVRAAIRRHDAGLSGWLDSPPQTNEVARSSVVLGAALHVAAATGMPLDLLEFGASAGLNLGFDRYGYDLGEGRTWGDPGAPLLIPADWRGTAPPLDARLEVVARAGCDRNPIDPASPADAARLLAYIWADQTSRIARIEAALALAGRSGIAIERVDAADWVESCLGSPQQSGVVRLLFHTIVWQYMPLTTQNRILAALQRAGEAATADTPLAHFGFENDENQPGGALHLTLWPGGKTYALGRADFHGRWVDWLPMGG